MVRHRAKTRKHIILLILLNMHIDEYLNRINYTGSREPCMETLQQLQLAHLLNVPFENLDIHSKTPIVLDVENIIKKSLYINVADFVMS